MTRTDLLSQLCAVRDVLRGFSSETALHLVERLIAAIEADRRAAAVDGTAEETLRAICDLHARLGRGPTRAEVAEELFLSQKGCDHRLRRLRAQGLVAEDGRVGRARGIAPSEAGRRLLEGT
jgi:response regulator of citrate/malate metabolism